MMASALKSDSSSPNSLANKCWRCATRRSRRSAGRSTRTECRLLRLLRRRDGEVVGDLLALVVLAALVGGEERGIGRGVLPAVFGGVELDLEMQVQGRRRAAEIVRDVADHVALLDVLVGGDLQL